MKKSVSLILLVCIISALLSGCGVLDGIHSVTLTGATDEIEGIILPFYRAGSEVVIRTHKIFDGGLYVFVNGDEVRQEQDGSDHWVYRFTMPDEDVTVHITSDPFWGRENYTFDELLYWVKNLEEGIGGVPVNGVALTVNNYSEEASFIEKRYSEKQEDIEKIKAITNQPLVKVDHSDVGETDIFLTYTFFCKDNPYMGDQVGDLEFDNGFFSYFYNLTSYAQPFRFEDPDYALPIIEDPDYVTYSFRREPRNIYIKKYSDDSFSERYDDLTCVEFVPYEGEPIDAVAEYYLDTSHGRIDLLTPTVFEIDGRLYEIVFGEKSWAYSSCISGGEK